MIIRLADVICVKQLGDTLTEGIEKSLTVTEYPIIFKNQGRLDCFNKFFFEGGGGRKQQISFLLYHGCQNICIKHSVHSDIAKQM